MTKRLRIASCQFPVSEDIEKNRQYIQRYMRKAAESEADLLHTSEASLSGYAGSDFHSFDHFNWDILRKQTRILQDLAKELNIWLVLGSAHFLAEGLKPTNCLYLINPLGEITNRYDKCMCTIGDQQHYSAGQRLVTHTINDQVIGLAICYDVCYPQIYTAYRDLGVKIMLHSFYNAKSAGKNCLDVLNIRQVPTRCADNLMWAVANNSSRPYSHWASFVARPDATIAKRLKINTAGMLLHDFPDTLSEGGWIHNNIPMQLAENEIMFYGQPTDHPRQINGQVQP